MPICVPCSSANGEAHKCDNVETCPCQHRTTVKQADGTLSPTSERNALLMIEDEKTVQL